GHARLDPSPQPPRALDDGVEVLGEDVSRRHERQRRRADPLEVRRARRVALLDRASPVASRSARVRGNGSVEPIMLMRSPGAPWVGWRGFQPVKVASGASTSTGRTPAIPLPSPSTADTKVTNGPPTLDRIRLPRPRPS